MQHMSELFSDAAPEREILSPSQLVRLARDLLEDTFPLIWIEGEISKNLDALLVVKKKPVKKKKTEV